jgi:hypothetical protein
MNRSSLKLAIKESGPSLSPDWHIARIGERRVTDGTEVRCLFFLPISGMMSKINVALLSISSLLLAVTSDGIWLVNECAPRNSVRTGLWLPPLVGSMPGTSHHWLIRSMWGDTDKCGSALSLQPFYQQATRQFNWLIRGLSSLPHRLLTTSYPRHNVWLSAEVCRHFTQHATRRYD